MATERDAGSGWERYRTYLCAAPELFREAWLQVAEGDLQKPAVGVSWYDAAVFAMWMGCRLPSEAEWEFACGAGSEGEWSTSEEERLVDCGWYSRNSKGRAHAVGMLKPNASGLFDMHGNVWEWCGDGYDQDFYGRSPTIDPRGAAGMGLDKVCRGGSFHALSEMCRTRYRFHEPAGFPAWDLGFRLVRDVIGSTQEEDPWLS